MKLRIKLPLIYTLLIALLGAVFILFTSKMVEDRMREEEAEYFESLTKTFAMNSANAIVLRDYAALRVFVDSISKGEHVSYAIILDENGSVLAHSEPEFEGKIPDDPVSIKASASRELLMQAVGYELIDVAAPLMMAGKNWGAVRIGFSERGMKSKVAKARGLIFIAGLAAIFLGGAAAIFIAKRITDPIHKLHRGTELIGEGNLDYRLDISTGDEIEQLATAFNTMTANLKENYLAIEKAKNEWEKTFDAISDPLFIHDREFKVLRCNRAYAEAAGMPFQELIGKPYYEVFPRMDGPMKGCSKVMKSQEEGEEEISVPAVDKIYKVSAYLIKDVDGGYLYSLHIMENITERKQAEAERRIQSEALRQAAEAVVVLDRDMHISYLNPAFYRLFGYTPEDIIGRPISTLSVPGQEDQTQPVSIMRQLKEKGTWSGEVQRLARDGTAIPIHLTASPIYDEKGEIAGYVGIYLDLREIKKVERALRESEEKFRTISMSANDAILMMDDDGNISFWNEAAETIFGHTAQEALGKGLHSFLAPGRYHAAYRAGFPKFKETGEGPVVGKMLELTAVKKDGTEFPMELSISVIKLKEKWHAIGILRDITERTQAEEAIRRSEASLAEAQRIARLGNWDWDLLKNELRWSDEIYRIFGLRPREFGVTYEAFLNSVHPEDREFIKNSVNESLYKKMPYSIDHRIVLPDGSTRFVHEQAEVAFDDKGRPVRMTGTVHDITDRKKADEELHELFTAALTSLAAAIEAKSPWTKGHSERVTEYALQIGRDMRLSDEDREELRIAALLHDIGKIGTYDEILDKPEKLTDEEFEIVKRHPGKAEDMLLPIKQLKRIIPWIRGHHERYDGKGYPDGLKGDEIPLQARILSVADTFDSMTAERPYRKMPGREKAIEELKRFSGSQFDPKVMHS